MTGQEGDVAGHLLASGSSWQPLTQESTPFFNAIVNDSPSIVEAEIDAEPAKLHRLLTLLVWNTTSDKLQNNEGEPPVMAKTSVAVKQRTPVHLAAQFGSLRVLGVLLSRGASPSALSPDGVSAAQAALNPSNTNAPTVLAMLKDAEPRQLDPVVAAPPSSARTAYSDVSPERAGTSGTYLGGLDMPHLVHQQEVEGDPFNPEGLPYSTSELTRPEYATDNFRMFCFKVLRCSKRYAHDWRACPFSHPTENARRRDPRENRYCSIACPDYKQGFCVRGEGCNYAHGVFECWLHPSKYRTQLCKDGANCHRPVCFFAHSLNELRTPTHTWTPNQDEVSAGGAAAPQASGNAIAPPPPAPEPTKPTATMTAAVLAYDELAAGAKGLLEAAASQQQHQQKQLSSHGDLGHDVGDATATVVREKQGYSSRSAGGAHGDMQRNGGMPHATKQPMQPMPPAQPSGPASAAAAAAAVSGMPFLGFNAPRMSNAFARRHGLNPKDNPMINLQKIALQAQLVANATGPGQYDAPGNAGGHHAAGRGAGRGSRKLYGAGYGTNGMMPPQPMHPLGMMYNPQQAQAYGPMYPGMLAMHMQGAGEPSALATLNQQLAALNLQQQQHAAAAAAAVALGGGGYGPGAANGYHDGFHDPRHNMNRHPRAMMESAGGGQNVV